VAEQPTARRKGYVGLPRWTLDRNVEVDWYREDAVEPIDARVVRLRETGRVRLTSVSSLRVVWCGAGLAVDRVEPGGLFPEAPWEGFGLEDPRLTPIEGRFYFTYVAVSEHGVATALASTDDLRRFERHGIIFPPENKDVVLFPERVGGSYTALHRPSGAASFTPPQMWSARSDDLRHWGHHEPFYGGGGSWEMGRVGAGTPPVRVEGGWLEIYHGSRRPERPGHVGAYQAAAFLLDADRPGRILRRTTDPILWPTEPYECEGFVPNVVFPTGIIPRDDTLLIYYGAADTCTAVAEMPVSAIVDRLNPPN
jgi:predicted GH43/DUF377 family glycosyl hydrolase